MTHEPGVVVFLGVSTASSLIHQALPRWGELVGRSLVCRGVDLPLDAKPADYLRVCDDLRRGDVLGAVVTSHKTALYCNARHVFASLDADARLTREINAIRRQGPVLHAWARDPVSAGRVLDEIWPDAGREMVCLGGGGTAVAVVTHLVRRAAAPSRVIICEPRAQRRDELAAFIDELQPAFPVDVAAGEADAPWDAVVREAEPGSLLVNATGRGKDLPGSPVSDDVAFPTGAVVWELNYRGRLDFLRQARRQQAHAGLRVHDGWALFCHGWAAALTPVLGLPDEPGLGEQFAWAVRDLAPDNG